MMPKARTLLLTVLVVAAVLGNASVFAQAPQGTKPVDLSGLWSGTMTTVIIRRVVESKLTLEVSANEPTKGRFALTAPERRTWDTPIEFTKDGKVQMKMGIHGDRLFSLEEKDGATILKTVFNSRTAGDAPAEYTVILKKER